MLKTPLILTAVLFTLTGCNKEQKTSHTPSVQKEPAARHIPMDGQSNFRDIGGYQTSDGKTVKWGKVFRSGELPKLSDDDVKKIDHLGIKTVVSFLNPTEIEARGEDRLPDDVKRIYLPIDVDLGKGASVEEVMRARKSGDFSKIPAESNPDIHRSLTRDSKESYTQLLRHLANPSNHPAVFHCSHGVHRTGTATALLLTALGVPWETVRKDYLLSNTYRKEEVAKRTEQLKQLNAKNNNIAPEDVDMTNINAFYILDGSYIDASLDEAIKEYGSIDKYIREGLGITEEEIATLRKLLLEPAK
jgi:protein-tyrosine phosphatase